MLLRVVNMCNNSRKKRANFIRKLYRKELMPIQMKVRINESLENCWKSINVSPHNSASNHPQTGMAPADPQNRLCPCPCSRRATPVSRNQVCGSDMLIRLSIALLYRSFFKRISLRNDALSAVRSYFSYFSSALSVVPVQPAKLSWSSSA